MVNYWEMHEAKMANSDDLISNNFTKTGHATRIINYFASKSFVETYVSHFVFVTRVKNLYVFVKLCDEYEHIRRGITHV